MDLTKIALTETQIDLIKMMADGEMFNYTLRGAYTAGRWANLDSLVRQGYVELQDGWTVLSVKGCELWRKIRHVSDMGIV